ncbi:MAG: FAD-binding protein, partial [Oceanobacillus sp.]|nr:FAD-binding protein [Oceanobacillus sp.]
MIYSDIEGVLPAEQIKHNAKCHSLGNDGNQIMEAYSEEDISKVLSFAYQQSKTVNIISGGT